MALLPLILLAPVLVAVAYFDLRFMRIPNLVSLMALALFLICALAFPPADLPIRLAGALAVFAAGFLAFAFRMIGGGDVKFLSALMLFIPASALIPFANIFSAALLTGIVLMFALRRIPASRTWGWKSFDGTNKLPMGLSIALAGIATPITLLFLQ